MPTRGETPAPVTCRAATSSRSSAAERTFRLKRMTPPGGYSTRKARVARSSVGPGMPTMKSWAAVRLNKAVPMPGFIARSSVDTGGGQCYLRSQGEGMAADRTTARYIAVEGPIGVGKTALARRLATEFGSRLLLEQVEENPFLRRFYDDPEKYAFQTQLFFLLERYRQQCELAQPDLFAQATVADYLFAKDGI